MPRSDNLSAVKYQLHVREIRADNARQWHGCFLCWWHRLAVWSKEWSSRHLSRRWAWPCIMWITSTVCYRSWNVVKLKCNNLSLVNSNSQDFSQDQDRDQDFYPKTKTKTLALKTKTKTKTLFFCPRDQDCGLEDYITAFWKVKVGGRGAKSLKKNYKLLKKFVLGCIISVYPNCRRQPRTFL